MPQSLVLSLETQSTVLSHHLQGHALQQLFFHLVDIIDSELAHVLRRDKKNCSYTLSAIQPGPVPRTKNTAAQLQYTHTANLEANTQCWWRVSFLDDALFGHLFSLWNQLSIQVFPLGSGSIKIKRVAFETSKALESTSWTSNSSYSDLYTQASAEASDIHLQFITPTTFSHGGAITPLPSAEAIFQPLRKHWNRYSGLVFAPSITSTIVPIQFNIQTQPVQTIRRNSFQTLTGCTGQISFHIGNHDDPLTVKRINALANFTQYCGIGINTCLGMGAVRRLQ